MWTCLWLIVFGDYAFHDLGSRKSIPHQSGPGAALLDHIGIQLGAARSLCTKIGLVHKAQITCKIPTFRKDLSFLGFLASFIVFLVLLLLFPLSLRIFYFFFGFYVSLAPN